MVSQWILAKPSPPQMLSSTSQATISKVLASTEVVPTKHLIKMLDNPKINIKIKLAALWTSVVFCYLYGDYFELYTPEKVDSLITGIHVLDSPFKLLIASIILAIPSVMVALSILLNPKTNRFLNVLFGTIFTLMMIWIGVNSFTPWYGFYAFLAFLESAITFSIVWLAWNWPKKVQ